MSLDEFAAQLGTNYEPWGEGSCRSSDTIFAHTEVSQDGDPSVLWVIGEGQAENRIEIGLLLGSGLPQQGKHIQLLDPGLMSTRVHVGPEAAA
ncbi:MAG: hypothetical protein ACRDH0_04985 [Actinomycetota bacterium]